MKNEKGTIFIRNKKGGLYGTPFQATTWAVEIHEIYPDRFKWVAKHCNVSMTAEHPVGNNKPFKTADEAYKDFLDLMRAQAICVCSKTIKSRIDLVVENLRKKYICADEKIAGRRKKS
jgi:hypothetical protein